MSAASPPSVLIIAGPTASGKTALAIERAQAENGVIINADSMQVYREIPILSAQPTPDEQRAADHRLYGCVSLLQHYSAAEWARAALGEIRAVYAAGQRPILVGGSGLYLQALVEGFSPLPDVPAQIRKNVTDLYDMLGPQVFHEALQAIDPVTAARLHATDRQRCIRAREIYEVSGTPLSAWHEQPKEKLAPDLTYEWTVLLPPRDWLYDRINRRFEQMMRMGAVDEARRVHALNPDGILTGTKALGLSQLRDVLDGRLTINEAIEQAQTASRQYAKRQYTWFKAVQAGLN